MSTSHFQIFKKFCTVVISLVIFATAGYGLFWASRSPLFLVRVVEVSDSAPEQFSHIVDLAKIPLNQVNLFDLDLGQIEQRILVDPWVRTVQIQKKLPETVQIQVTYREPVALLQSKRGPLVYIDQDGTRFGKHSLQRETDLPILHLTEQSPPLVDKQVRDALSILKGWNQNTVATHAQLSSIAYDPERAGYRVWISYALGKDRRFYSRPVLQIPQATFEEFQPIFTQLSRVIQYLSDHAVPTRQIFADSGKKVVVKIRRDS